MDRVVIVFEGCKEEGYDYGEADDLHYASGEEGWLAAEVNECSMDEDGVGMEEGCGFADQSTELGGCGDSGWVQGCGKIAT